MVVLLKRRTTRQNFARHESGVRHTTRNLGAKVKAPAFGGDDPAPHVRGPSPGRTECRAPRAWWPTPGEAHPFTRGASSWRRPSLRPRASLHSHVLACDLRAARRPGSTSTAFPPAPHVP